MQKLPVRVQLCDETLPPPGFRVTPVEGARMCGVVRGIRCTREIEVPIRTDLAVEGVLNPDAPDVRAVLQGVEGLRYLHQWSGGP